jgi:hypothetical protein
LRKFLVFEEANGDFPVIFQAMNQGKRNGSHSPFFITFLINNLLFHNCMLDYGASTNVTSLKVMNQVGLKTTCSYKNGCAKDSREIEVCGLIKDIQVKLVAYIDITLLMDIVIIDVPIPRCMGIAFIKEMGYQFRKKHPGGFVICHHTHMRKHLCFIIQGADDKVSCGRSK